MSGLYWRKNMRQAGVDDEAWYGGKFTGLLITHSTKQCLYRFYIGIMSYGEVGDRFFVISLTPHHSFTKRWPSAWLENYLYALRIEINAKG